MIEMPATSVTIEIPGGGAVSGIWQAPKAASAGLDLAHGAGAGMTHRSIAAIADGLERLGVATLRYQFPYMETGGRRPDSPAVAQLTAWEEYCAGEQPLAPAIRKLGKV